MLEIGFVAVQKSEDVHLILVDRAANDLALDSKLVNYPIARIQSPFNGLNLRRLISFPLTAYRVATCLLHLAEKDTVVITNTFDMLLVARMVQTIRHIRIRHQVRDLHALQLSSGFSKTIFRALERKLLKGCELILYSAPGFIERYYEDIFGGATCLLENLPRREVWQSFRPKSWPRASFKIGYIGIVRYMSPLRNLIDAIEILLQRGLNYSALIAGGGDQSTLTARVKHPQNFEFSGKFEYTENVVALHEDIDLIFAVYDRFDLNCQIAMPTKFYEALLSRIPILVSKGTYVGELVERMGIGLAVDGESVTELVSVLEAVGSAQSWYGAAREVLQTMDASDFFVRYDAALNIAVSRNIMAPETSSLN